MVRLSKKLTGSTLVETIVSMVLIVLIMAVAFHSLSKSNHEFNSESDTYVAMKIKSYLHDIPATEGYTEIQDEFSSLIITLNLTSYRDSESLFVYEVKASDKTGRIIASARRIVSVCEMNLNKERYDK